MLAGNTVPEGAAPLAQAYAGHQVRRVRAATRRRARAILLGEVMGPPTGAAGDIQLKGAGRTPFRPDGRRARLAGAGDARIHLSPRPWAALGIPTTRALAAVTTGETVLREAPPARRGASPGFASSHIRVRHVPVFSPSAGTTRACAP